MKFIFKYIVRLFGGCGHEYEQWGEPYEAEYMFGGIGFVQFRKCKRCGKQELHKF